MNSYQQPFWYLMQLYPQAQTTTLAAWAQLKGDISPELFTKALQQVADQHPALKLSIDSLSGTLTIPETAPDLPLFIHSTPQSLAQIQQHIAQEATQGIDSQAPLLWKTSLWACQAPALGWVWSLQMHHLIADGWSFLVFFKQLSATYQALIAQEPISPQPLRPLLLPQERPADAVFWQEKTLRRISPQGAGLHPIQRQSFSVSPTKRQQLQAKLAPYQVEPIHFCLLVFLLVLKRYNTHLDLQVGIPLLNRSSRAERETIGLFANFMPLSPLPDIYEVWHAVAMMQWLKGQLRQMYRHQAFPLWKLGQNLDLAPDERLFNVLFSFEKHPFGESFAGLPATLQYLPPMWDENLLTLHSTDYGEQNPLVFSVDYATEIWTAAQIQMLWSQAVRLAIQLLKYPLAVWRELPVGVGLKSRSVHRKTMPPLDEVPHVDFLQAYRQACAATPRQVALITARQTLSFETLQQRALQIAAYLQSLENHTVALLCPRNANLLVGILGIWQAGKTPLLLSPQDSAERHQQLLTFCHHPFLLTEVVIEALADPDQAPRNLINTLPTEAYLTFTSGSTGEPKPVVVSATAYTNTKQGWLKHYQLENSIHLQWAAQTFDVFWGDVARSLLSGQTLLLLDEKQRLDPNLLVPIITQYQVTHWETTPSFALLLTNDLPMLRSLRLLVVGSDKLTWSAAQALRQALPANTQLLNSYGLTECTIDSSFWVVPPQLNIAKAKLNRPTPVGFPLPNQQLWVMDRYLQPLPIWAVGEVWIAGYSLADDTLWQDEKLYATGDLGYYHPEDGLVLVGRSDTQLKINGLRINPKEVEQALLQFSWVVQVAVVQHHSHQQLVAWIQTSDPHFNWAEQRQQLFAFLPSYAVPHQAFAIDSFPLSAHGKIDYKALAQKPLPTLAVEPAENNTPLTPAAQALAHSLRQIGAPETTHWDRSLYENGLHSIQVIRLVGLLREAGWHIALPQILQSESLLQIAKLLTNAHPQKNPQTFEKLADEDIDWDNLLDALNEQLD